MLFIIGHHFVVNSGVMDLIDINSLNANMVFLQMFGQWGKAAINIFILISGYFMCTSKLTVRKYVKLFLQIWFYRIIIGVVLICLGYQSVGLKDIVNLIVPDFRFANNSFTASFLIFYLFIPFMNLLIRHLNGKQLLSLNVLLLLVFTGLGTFFFNANIFTEIGWYISLYFLGSYVRLYPQSWMKNNKICIPLFLISFISGYVSIIAIDFIGPKIGFTNYYYFVIDSHKLVAFLVGFSSFLMFHNFKPRYNKVINAVSSTTFGVLLIHANSMAMINVLWKNIVNVVSWFDKPLYQLVPFAFGIVVVIFVGCSAIDYLRIVAIEKPLFKFLDRKGSFDKIQEKLDKVIP